MEKILDELCAELNNYFRRDIHSGEYVISGGSIDLHEYIQDGQYFRIVGSVFNEGVHKYPATDLKDEVFRGAIWSMAVPETVLDLASDIDEWKAKYEDVNSSMMSPFTSESFGTYSYSKSSGGTSGGAGDTSNSWQGAFASRLNKWRRLRGLN